MITLEKLGGDDWEVFKSLRLRALEASGEVFCPSTDESKRSEEEWREIVSSPQRAIFALRDYQTPIGLTGVVTDRDDPSGQTALFVMSFIEPDYRGRGLSRLFYESRIEWVEEQKSFRKILVGHRKGNYASERSIKNFGFSLIESRMQTWPDQTECLLFMYERLVEYS